MRQLVPEDINENRARKPEKSNQPEHGAQREKPKFFSCPKPLRRGCPRESSKKRLTKYCADRYEKNREHKFHPARRDCEPIRQGNDCSRACNVANDLTAALGIALSPMVCRSSLLCGQSCRKLRRLAQTNARLKRWRHGYRRRIVAQAPRLPISSGYHNDRNHARPM